MDAHQDRLGRRPFLQIADLKGRWVGSRRTRQVPAFTLLWPPPFGVWAARADDGRNEHPPFREDSTG